MRAVQILLAYPEYLLGQPRLGEGRHLRCHSVPAAHRVQDAIPQCADRGVGLQIVGEDCVAIDAGGLQCHRNGESGAVLAGEAVRQDGASLAEHGDDQVHGPLGSAEGRKPFVLLGHPPPGRLGGLLVGLLRHHLLPAGLMRCGAVLGMGMGQIRERKVVHHNTLGHRTRTAALELDLGSQISHIADPQIVHPFAAALIEMAELTGPEEPPGAHPGQLGDVTEVPCAGELCVAFRCPAHARVTAAAIALCSRPSSAFATVRK